MKKVFIISGLGSVLLIIFLSTVFSGKFILPQTFSIGSVVIHYYGITMALAIASSFYFAIKRAAKFGITKDQAEDLLFWLIIGGFIGARLYHVLSSAPYYLERPLEAFMVWQGGLSIYGAVIGGLVTICILKRISNIKYLVSNILNWLTPSILLGQIIGRFGNFFNYEAFGYPTNLPWKMFVPETFRPFEYIQSQYFHPFFIYEALGNLIILLVLLRIEKEWVPAFAGAVPSGQLFFFYLLLYNILRFGLEFLRIDSTFIHGYRLNAVVSFVLVFISAAYFLKNEQIFKVP